MIENSEGFFANLPPMKGALEALQQMEKLNFNVYICTSPLLSSSYCAQEKILWIKHHLGEAWLSRLIMTSDKVQAKGDILIDDKPMELLEPGGRHNYATWKQVFFDQPYNQHCRNIPRIKRWSDCLQVLLPLFGQRGVPECCPVSAAKFTENSVRVNEMKQNPLNACLQFMLHRRQSAIQKFPDKFHSNLPNSSLIHSAKQHELVQQFQEQEIKDLETFLERTP